MRPRSLVDTIFLEGVLEEVRKRGSFLVKIDSLGAAAERDRFVSLFQSSLQLLSYRPARPECSCLVFPRLCSAECFRTGVVLAPPPAAAAAAAVAAAARAKWEHALCSAEA